VKKIQVIIFILILFFSQIVRGEDEPFQLNAKQIFALNKLTEALSFLTKYEDDLVLYFDFVGGKCTKKNTIIEKASQGDLNAKYWLVSMHLDGFCMKVDGKKGLELLIELGHKGYAEAQRDLGHVYRVGHWNELKNLVIKNESIALEWYEKAANNNEGLSAYYYANYLFKGEIVMQDFYKAEKYYNIAIKSEDAKAKKMAYMSLLRLKLKYFKLQYDQGDIKSAQQYYDQAIELAIECSNMGYSECMMMASGLLGPTDLVEAYKWANLATAFNEDPLTKDLVRNKALEDRKKFESKMTLNEILLAQKLSKEWLPF